MGSVSQFLNYQKKTDKKNNKKREKDSGEVDVELVDQSQSSVYV